MTDSEKLLKMKQFKSFWPTHACNKIAEKDGHLHENAKKDCCLYVHLRLEIDHRTKNTVALCAAATMPWHCAPPPRCRHRLAAAKLPPTSRCRAAAAAAAPPFVGLLLRYRATTSLNCNL